MLCRAGCTHTCAAWQHCMGKPESAKLLLSTVAVGRAPSTSMRTLHLVSSWPCSLACDLVSTPAFVDSSLPCSGFACAQERAGRLPCWCGNWRVFLCFLPSQDAASLRSSKALRMFLPILARGWCLAWSWSLQGRMCSPMARVAVYRPGKAHEDLRETQRASLDKLSCTTRLLSHKSYYELHPSFQRPSTHLIQAAAALLSVPSILHATPANNDGFLISFAGLYRRRALTPKTRDQ